MENDDGALEIIRRFEGLRLDAYRDAGGVWTIGYGHTDAAAPPRVTQGMHISAEEADRILAADVRRVRSAIDTLITRPLTPGQRAALTSFAYNVGVENFRRSSVLTAVNAGEFDKVPHRLALWVKAKGRTVPGLIRRRAEEGALFAKDSQPPAPDAPGRPVEPRPGKPLTRSTTGLAAMLSALAGIFSAVGAAANASGGHFALGVTLLVIVFATVWILRERRRKAVEDGV